MSQTHFQKPFVDNDTVITKADYYEVYKWCIENNIAAYFYGRFMPNNDEYWVVHDPNHRVLFKLRWEGAAS